MNVLSVIGTIILANCFGVACTIAMLAIREIPQKYLRRLSRLVLLIAWAACTCLFGDYCALFAIIAALSFAFSLFVMSFCYASADSR